MADEVTLRDVYDIVNARADRTDKRLDALETRMGSLETSTNHKVDALHDLIEVRRSELEKEIDTKADADSLLTSMGFYLMRNKVVRWVLGAAGAAVFATAVKAHWFTYLAHLLER